MIFCERKTSKTFDPGESHDFNTESDAGSDRLYEVSGVYYSYSSLKIKGYLTRVFANGELVNVTVSQPTNYFFPAWIALVSIVLLVRRPPRGFALEASPRE